MYMWHKNISRIWLCIICYKLVATYWTENINLLVNLIMCLRGYLVKLTSEFQYLDCINLMVNLIMCLRGHLVKFTFEYIQYWDCLPK